MANVLAGQADRADPILADAVEVAPHAGALPAASAALAERAVVALERHDWPQAETLAAEALAIVRAGQLDDYIMSPLVNAVVARTALHRRDVQRAHQHLARAARLRPLLTYAIPWLAVQAPLELVRAYLALGDVAGARVVLGEAPEVLRRRPDLGTLPEQAVQLRSKASGLGGGIVGASSLTKAELRLLPLLPTQLTQREIGERLYLSEHRGKKEAMSIHRKLGVSSRSQTAHRAATRPARRVGLAWTIPVSSGRHDGVDMRSCRMGASARRGTEGQGAQGQLNPACDRWSSQPGPCAGAASEMTVQSTRQ
jgi:LuxR family maltose regulon positive regulatory protein